LPQSLPAQTSIEHLHRVKCHARSNLDQDQFFHVARLRKHRFVLVDYLVRSEEDLAIQVVERNNMVDKRLRLGMVLGRVKSLNEHLLNQLEMGCALEASVEGDEGPRVLKAVALQLELFRGVDVFHFKFHTGACGGLSDPQEEVLVLVALEVHKVVAAALEANVVDDRLYVLGRDARFALGVSDEELDVADQVQVGVGDAAGGKDHCALAVLPIF
jgi:hypothetical protein